MNIDDERIDFAIKVLNEALEADPEAMNKLFNVKVQVNDELLNHPTIQCNGNRKDMGPMGLINGLFGADDNSIGFICMHVDIVNEDPFEVKISRFDRTDLEKAHPASHREKK